MSKLSPVSYQTLGKIFEADGFRCVRIEGDHMVFAKPGFLRPFLVRAGLVCPSAFLIAASTKSFTVSEGLLSTWSRFCEGRNQKSESSESSDRKYREQLKPETSTPHVLEISRIRSAASSPSIFRS